MASRKVYFSAETWTALNDIKEDHSVDSISAVIRMLAEAGAESPIIREGREDLIRALRLQRDAAQKARTCRCGEKVYHNL